MKLSSIAFLASFITSISASHACEHDHRHLRADPNLPDQVPEFVNDIVFQAKNGKMQTGTRCATARAPDRSGRELHEHYERKLRWELTVPVAFTVIYSGNQGNVPDSMIIAQMNVLNDAFAGTGLTFTLANIYRREDPSAYTGCYDNQSFKQSYCQNPAQYLNIYSCSPSGGILGYAYYPSSFPEGDKRHGVVILDESMPGGTASPYNLGDTLVHEVGHYFNLAHTFNGGCSGSGDFISDTPAEQSPAYGCPVGRDSCPTGAGLDPIYNFMDYTTDSCMYQFTDEQIARMQNSVELYKPTMAANIVTTPTDPPTLPPVAPPTPPPVAPPTPPPSCTSVGGACNANSDCCSRNCKGKSGRKVCK